MSLNKILRFICVCVCSSDFTVVNTQFRTRLFNNEKKNGNKEELVKEKGKEGKKIKELNSSSAFFSNIFKTF